MMLGLDLKELLPIIFTTVTAIFVGYKEWKERRTSKDHGLLPNPQRCEKHEDRLGTLEKDCATMLADIANIKEDVAWLRDRNGGKRE